MREAVAKERPDLLSVYHKLYQVQTNLMNSVAFYDATKAAADE